MAGVPVIGVVDSRSDITIVNGELMKRVAAVAKLQKRDLKKPDKMPTTCDCRPFVLHERLDFELSFEKNSMKTLVYVKLDATELLLHSEGVCHQLGITSYHPKVHSERATLSSPTIRRGPLLTHHTSPSKIEPDQDQLPCHEAASEFMPQQQVEEKTVAAKGSEKETSRLTSKRSLKQTGYWLKVLTWRILHCQLVISACYSLSVFCLNRGSLYKLISDPSVDLSADEAMLLENLKEFENITRVQL